MAGAKGKKTAGDKSGNTRRQRPLDAMVCRFTGVRARSEGQPRDVCPFSLPQHVDAWLKGWDGRDAAIREGRAVGRGAK